LGLDLVCPFKKGKGGFTHIFVIVDKFTKWIEVKPAASITAAKVVEFIKEIMYRFDVPNKIIIDNGTQLTAREFKDFCADSSIKINQASVSHSQSNSHVERSNGMILEGLKPRIFDRLKPYAGKWVEELPSVLWALCTTLSHATGHTQFSLVLGTEAILPTKVEHKSFCMEHFNEEQSNNYHVNDLTAWLYNGENDITRLEHGHDMDLDRKVLVATLMKLSFDPNSRDFINPHPHPPTPLLCKLK
jgi:hypothetical protein